MTLLAVVLAGLSALGASAHAAGTTWTTMPLPNGIDDGSTLAALTCTSSTTCTAVGSAGDGHGLLEHLAGGAWAEQSASTGSATELLGVSCPSDGECVAVGGNTDGSVILHQESGTWTTVTAPALDSSAVLRSVSCPEANHCVAVGTYYDAGSSRYRVFSDVLVDGTWTLLHGVDPGDDVNEAFGIDCPSTDSCTMVGYSASSGSSEHFLVEHFDGDHWSTLPVSDVAVDDNELDAIDCADAEDCTAVGYGLTIGGSSRSVVEHWDGTSWSAATGIPYVGRLRSVSCASSSACTAAGEANGLGTAVQLLVLDDGTWTQETAPTPSSDRDQLTGAACPSPDACFLAGQRRTQTSGGAATALVETSVPQPDPVVSAVSPLHGAPAGGTTVHIAGSGFSGATAVLFGGTPAASMTVDSDGAITAVSPPGTPGVTDVQVSGPSGTSVAWLADRFTYVAPPVVTGVTPPRGSDQGGETVVVSGSGFIDVTGVGFENDDAEWGADAESYVVDSDTQITVTTPSTADDFEGTADVVVSAQGGDSALTPADEFTFGTPTTVRMTAEEWTVYPRETTSVSVTVDPVPGAEPSNGTITVSDGDGPVAGCLDLPVPTADGTVNCDLTYSTVGHRRITAVYSGGPGTLPSSAAHELVVDQQPTEATLTVSPTPTAGEPVTYTAGVSPQPAGGTVAFSDDGDGIAGCATRPVEDGAATCTTTYGAAGEHAITASYTGTKDFSPAQASATVSIARPSARRVTTTTVTTTPTSPSSGALVEYVATTDPAPGGGTVAFTDGDTAVDGCAAVPLASDGVAVCVSTAGQSGDHTIGADYSGDDVNAPSTGTASVRVAVVDAGSGPVATTASLGVPDNPTAGAPLTYTVTVSPAPTAGTITFTDDGTALPGCAALAVADAEDAPTAACSARYSDIGSHVIAVTYSGDAELAASSARRTVSIGAPSSRSATTLTLATAPHDPVTGQLVTLTASVAPAPDGGTVAFTDGNGTLAGCGAVAPGPGTGIARCQVAYGDPGTQVVHAAYSGDTLFEPSASDAVPVGVTSPSGGGTGVPAAVTITLGADPADASPNDPVTYTAELDPATANGTVTFTDNGDPLPHCSAVEVVDGTAQCTTSYSTGGSHRIRASYSGGPDFSPATSPVLEETVSATTTVTFTGGPTAVVIGDTSTYEVRVEPTPGGGTVAFTDAGEPVPGCSEVTVDHDSGTAACDLALGTPGSHTLGATYSGVLGFAPSSGSWTVAALAPTDVSGAASTSSRSVFDHTQSYACGNVLDPETCTYDVYRTEWDIVLHAQVHDSSGGGTPTGSVTFATADAGDVCSAAVSPDGSATCYLAPRAPGSPLVVTATYSGDAEHTSSVSAEFTARRPYPTTTTLDVSSVAPVVGQTVTLSATVGESVLSDSTGPVRSGGTVTFSDDGTPVPGCANVSVATNLLARPTCTTAFDVAGSHVLSASYSGAEEDQASSATTTVMVAPPPDVVPPAAPDGVTDVQTAVSTSPQGTATTTSDAVSASASGRGALTLGRYPSRPTGTDGFSGRYFDLKLAPGNAFSQVTVTDCNLGGARSLYFWDGDSWVAASSQRYDARHDPPCITSTINETTRPRLSELTGTAFAVGRPKEKPTLAVRYGTGRRVTLVLRTRPALGRHRVTLYVVRHHGVHRKLQVLRRATTDAHGVARFHLVRHRSAWTLRARVSGRRYLELLSSPVRVRRR